jgi:hypothetical protein
LVTALDSSRLRRRRRRLADCRGVMMANRPRSTRISNQSDVVHLVVFTHDDENMVTTLCGFKSWGVDKTGSKLCARCKQTFTDIAAEHERLTEGRLREQYFAP